ncbi:glutamate-5-semialdehyde dehydrogenase [Candidatus Hakubella thermalkaliphila]|uniref:Gamma-glutamyl phosphate reductase n=3 Tax=Candidatus Hakubella thermalkaliphila TaxID=2754717 RepID=A0A6V8QA58_9ACTN|nr:glutamate-5-semialdehyde dehydrogenase [Candidatus Hakubella thermalkaliphila]GFP34681.1 glutamate-5-semialdehyde dehydrogenase [Candidatus Hakubella thermalkaliphila]GFP41659.1 glutamate-5-semialdehyde dehydrogenase [Candidatus Hakubella thermalkaliphila]
MNQLAAEGILGSYPERERQMMDLTEMGQRAKKAATILASSSTQVKNSALILMADALMENSVRVMEANQKDVEESQARGMSEILLDRLVLNEKRVADMAEGIKSLIGLSDPVGEIIWGSRLPNGLILTKVRVPLGVVGIIYEARPNVTVDASVLCLKSGNAVILRGSSNTLSSNVALVGVLRDCLKEAGLPEDSIQLVSSPEREYAVQLMRLREYVDVLIPRGGKDLIENVVANSTVPVIETGIGNCHIYVDENADVEMALQILLNAKTQRPSVCNAAESLLVHGSIADVFLPRAIQALTEKKVTVYGCSRTLSYGQEVLPASEDDYYREYLDLKIAVKVLDSLQEAIDHINKYGSHHSDAIVTNDYSSAQKFTQEVDSAAVYVNASTRFTDGFQYGLGAEIGISTQRLHARGPMGLKELTTSKFVVYGQGQVRK